LLTSINAKLVYKSIAEKYGITQMNYPDLSETGRGGCSRTEKRRVKDDG
jgi:hypothetical protein